MDGLECSEVKLSQVIKSERSFRTDAEFYQKAYINMQEELFLKKSERLKPHTKKIDVGFVGAMVEEFTEDVNDPILLQTKNVKEFFVDTTNCIHINTAFHLQLRKSQIHKEDVLIARSGSFGKASIFLDDGDTNSSDIIIVETTKDLNPFYLTTFLNSRLGRMQLYRFASGGLQGHVNLTILENLMVPLLEDSFQRRIERLIRLASVKVKQADALYNKAEYLLSCSLGLNAYIFRTQSTSIKNLDESFSISGRLDAEYYQPKYAEYERIIRSNSLGFTYVKNVFAQVTTKCDRNQQAYKYTEIGDIDVATGNASYNVIFTEDLPDNAKILTQIGDVLVSMVRPNRGAVAIIEENNRLVSGAFTVLRQIAGYPKEILQLLLRTNMYRDWLLKYNVGTSYPVIKDNDILNMPIPIFDVVVIKNAVDKVRESRCLRHRSEELLEYAKRAVEVAIEEGEEKAMEWLKEKGVEC